MMEPDVNANEEIPKAIFLFLNRDKESEENELNENKQQTKITIRLFFKWLMLNLLPTYYLYWYLIHRPYLS